MTEQPILTSGAAAASSEPPPPPPFRGGLLDPRLRVTLSLVLLNAVALVYASGVAPGPTTPWGAFKRGLGLDLAPTLIGLGAFSGYLIEAGERWRLLTAMFLHQGVIHLMLNMMALLYFAVVLEPVLGRARFVVLYLGAGVCGSLFAYGINVLSALGGAPLAGPIGSVGASGAVFGLVGALIAGEWVAHGSLASFLRSPYARRMFSWLFVMILMGFAIPIIDGNAHLGGLLGGFAIGMHFFSRMARQPNARLRWIGSNALYAAVAGCALALFASTRPVKTPAEYNQAIIALLRNELGRPDLALKWIDAKKKDDATAILFWTRQRASLLLGMCEYAKAREEAARALALSAHDGHARYLSGTILWRLGDLEGAAADLERAVGIAREVARLRQSNNTPRTNAEEMTASAAEEAFTSGSLAPSAVTSAAASVTTSAPAERLVAAASERQQIEDWRDLAEMAQVFVLRQMKRGEEWRAAAAALSERLLARAAVAEQAVAKMKAGAKTFEEKRALHETQLVVVVDRNMVAWMHAVLDSDLDVALRLANQALQAFPETPLADVDGLRAAVLDTRAWIYFRQGRYALALRDLGSALRLTPRPSAEMLYHLAAVYAALNRPGDAREYLDKSLDMKEDFDSIHEALELRDSINPTSKRDSQRQTGDFARGRRGPKERRDVAGRFQPL